MVYHLQDSMEDLKLAFSKRLSSPSSTISIGIQGSKDQRTQLYLMHSPGSGHVSTTVLSCILDMHNTGFVLVGPSLRQNEERNNAIMDRGRILSPFGRPWR